MSERKQTTLRLPVDLYERIQQEAERKGITVNEELSKFIRENYLKSLLH